MARIESLGEYFHFTDPREKIKTRKGKTRAGAFSSILGRSVEESESQRAAGGDDVPGSGDLEELLDEVYSRGDALKKGPGESAVLAYKRAVQGFLRHVLGKLYETERHQSRPNLRKGTQKAYLLVKVVDQKLDRLVADVLKSQIQQLEILKRIEEINGMLVDLVG